MERKYGGAECSWKMWCISTAAAEPSQPLRLIYRKYLLWMICLRLCLYYICHAEKKDSSRCQRLSTVCFWDFGPQMWKRIALLQRADNWWSLQKAFSGERSWSFRIITLANAVRAQRSLLRGLSDHVELSTRLILFLLGLFFFFFYTLHLLVITVLSITCTETK